ncbi:gamma-butyrobetaine dioxygenase-like [Penaeus monodon]|uniref:gamma-butyrobetaine dioxygenase-like n=1 Tax=Penaeus monodon TaxID=6687 RepID=UPI0018A7D657|nr:gamma-butyrobetaine dioxygenase-like [Penaeus monodon]
MIDCGHNGSAQVSSSPLKALAMQAGWHFLLRRGSRILRDSARLVRTSARVGSTRQMALSAAPLCDKLLKRNTHTSVTPDLNRPRPKLASASQDHNTLKVQVRWRDGERDEFPYVWLRDNCQCPDCFLRSASSRLLRVAGLSTDVRPREVQVSNDGYFLKVVWENGHESTYVSDWLNERAFNPRQQSIYNNTYRLRPELWDADMAQRIPRASFDELMEDDAALLKLLECMEVLGFTVVSGARQEEGELQRLSERASHLVPSNYGTTFIVKDKKDASNVAYTSQGLDLHCDLVCLHYKPCVQLLHCISQFEGDGGDSILADSHRVALQMRELYPQKFRFLTDVLVNFRDVATDEGFEFDIIARRPMISVRADGEIKTVNMSTFGRDSHFGVSPNDAIRWYDAYVTFCELLYRPENHFTFKLEAGEILIMDNLRILHGRTAYEDTVEGVRRLEGGFWDWDMMRSRRRGLQRKLGGCSEISERAPMVILAMPERGWKCRVMAKSQGTCNRTLKRTANRYLRSFDISGLEVILQ